MVVGAGLVQESTLEIFIKSRFNLLEFISGGPEVVSALVRREGHKAVGDRVPKLVDGSCGGFPQPRHLRRGGGLVDEDQLLRLKIGLGVEPGLAAAQDIGALLLGGVRRLFLNVTPRLSRKYQIVDGTT